MDKVLNLIQDKTYNISGILLANYRKLKLNGDEFVVLVYLINNNDKTLNYQDISEKTGIDKKEVLMLVNSLVEKDLISINLDKVNGKSVEVYNLDSLYKKLYFFIIKEEPKKDKVDLFPVFEKEFGRTLTPMDYEIITAWQEAGFDDKLIVLALKEAVYNGVTNLRYIDKILYEWKKKGIKNKEDIEKDRSSFNKRKESKNLELFDYDWLNEEE